MSTAERRSSSSTLEGGVQEKHTDTTHHDPPPDGGTQAWMTVAGAWWTFFCTTGFSNAMGVFQTYYGLHQLSHESESAIGWIGSLNICMTFFLTLAVGGFSKKVNPRVFIWAGTVITAFAFMMWSLSSKYWHFILVQGILLAIGWSCLVLPSMVGCQSYFEKRRSLAIGISISGSSMGGVVWPIMLDRLLNGTNLGFGWSLRIVGFTQLGLLTLGSFLMVPRPNPAGHDAVPNMALLKTKAYYFGTAGLFVVYFAMFAPFFFVSLYAISRGVDVNLAFYMVSILNGSSAFGRIIPGLLADWYGCFNMLTAACLASAIVAFCWTAAKSTVGVIFFAIAYGFTSGAILSQQTAGFAQLAKGDSATAAMAMGLGMGAIAGPALAGTPIAGALVDRYGFLSLSMFTGAILVVGAALIWASRLAQNRKLFAVV